MKLFLTAMVAAVLIPLSPAHAATLARAQLTITSAISVDTSNHTVTLPLRRGSYAGKSVWYIITDASDAREAKALGVNYAPSLAQLGNTVISHVEKKGDQYLFPGAPDFSKTRTYVASATGFPPKSATPGATADGAYSPFVRADGTSGVLNASIVATGDAPFDVTTHTNTQDRVIAIDSSKKTVTLALARGFFNGKPVFYLSTEASDAGAASVERATYVPSLAKSSPSGEVPIGVIVNGPQTGSQPQGLAFLALRTPLAADATAANISTINSPFNVLSLAPSLVTPDAANGYSPLWNVVVVGAPQTKRLTSFAQVAPIAKPAGFVVNCPVVAYGDDSGD